MRLRTGYVPAMHRAPNNRNADNNRTPTRRVGD